MRKKKNKNDFFNQFNLKKKIGIGTIQFSAPYGVANKTGQVNLKEIKKIKEFAKKSDIRINIPPIVGVPALLIK